MCRRLFVLLVLAAAGSGCSDADFMDFTDFQRFTFERQNEAGVHSGTVQTAMLARTDDGTMRATLTVLEEQTDGGGECLPGLSAACLVEVEVPERVLGAAEAQAVLAVFFRVLIQQEPDAENCPLFDPAFIDVYGWDDFSVTTDLCRDTYLRFEDAEAIYATLETLAPDPAS